MEAIKYYSTNRRSPVVSFKDALIQGLAPDRGLFMPEEIPKISPEEIMAMRNKKYWEIAFEVTKRFLSSEVSSEELQKICKDAYNFPVPIETIFERNFLLRLDHGPTASFKDFAARMMSRLLQFFLQHEEKSLTILTATSGDTGSAVANAFFGLRNIRIVVLFPEKEVSEMQRKQMTTLGENITAIAIDGKFDDCQAMVKQAFVDKELHRLNLSSANSINIGRLLPQAVYYFYAYSKVFEKNKEQIVFSVPSGNFGNCCAGLIAERMGLPVKRFVVAVNENNEFPRFLATGKYETIVPSMKCLSNAMNVGHPSNLARVMELYDGRMDETGKIIKMPDLKKMRQEIFSLSVTDGQTRQAIKNAYSSYNVLLEPHGAVAWFALQQFLNKHHNGLCVSIETAHPAKFPETIRETAGIESNPASALAGLETKREEFEKMPNNYRQFKEFLLKKF